jgi:hypothetical protein
MPTEISVVLSLLSNTGFVAPQPDSDISGWFAALEKEDKLLGHKPSRTDMFIISYLHHFPDADLGKKALLNDDFPTPQDLADNAT